MRNNTENFQYTQIRDYKYEEFFQDIQYNGKVLSKLERDELIRVIDDEVDFFSQGLPLLYKEISLSKNVPGIYQELSYTVNSVSIFVLFTMIDCMVASKYFLLADKDYERRYMRGKLMVILNEGFKRLYGFNQHSFKNSEWDRLLPFMKYFPKVINLQYQEVSYHLSEYAKSSLWWKEERDIETHLEAEKMYVFRAAELVESKVMIDAMKLYNTLLGVNHFLTNAHGCIVNYLVKKYYDGELDE